MHYIIKRAVLTTPERFAPGAYFLMVLSEREGWEKIAEHEKKAGTAPGCDHGFGAGSGLTVISSAEYDALWAQ